MSGPAFNVSHHLERQARERPDAIAVHVPIGKVRRTGHTPHRGFTFAELNGDVDAIAYGFRDIGLSPGTRVALMVPPGVHFFALAFACFKAEIVPVMIDPGMGMKNVGTCLAEAEPAAFIGIARAHAARWLCGWGKPSIHTTINVGRGRFFCTESLAELREIGRDRGPFPVPHSRASDLAAILFTSGSTGIAKGAEYTHGIFSAQVEMLKRTYGIAPGEVDLCTFPLFALFGPALGLTCVVPEMNASKPATIDPYKAAAQIRQFGATQLFGSPAVIRRLSELEGQQPKFDSLKRVVSAGAPATIPVLERFGKLLPDGVEIFTPYGATEALPVANIGSRTILNDTRQLTERGHGVCIGRPVEGVEVRIIRIDDGPIPRWSDSLLSPPGEVGEIVVRGPIVTERYFRREAATALAKIVDESTGEVLHRMGDVGYFDADGRLWFCGRKSHRVATPHGTLFTDMVEPVFNGLEGVTRRTALIGVHRGGIVHPAICYEIAEKNLGNAEQLGILRKRASEFSMTERIDCFLPYVRLSFPVDARHNSKIFREKLAVWADEKLGPNWKGGPA